MKSIIKCMYTVKANAECEHLSEQFCDDENALHLTLLLPTELKLFHIAKRIRLIYF